MEGKLSRSHWEERGPRRRWWRGGTLVVAEKNSEVERGWEAEKALPLVFALVL